MSGLQTPPNLEELFGKLLDGELQGAEQEQINQALGSDPAMRLLYRKYVMLDAALRWEMAAPIVPPGDDVAAAGGQSGIGAIAGTAGPSGRVVSRPAFRRDDAPFDAESANEECGRANDEPPVDCAARGRPADSSCRFPPASFSVCRRRNAPIPGGRAAAFRRRVRRLGVALAPGRVASLTGFGSFASHASSRRRAAGRRHGCQVGRL